MQEELFAASFRNMQRQKAQRFFLILHWIQWRAIIFFWLNFDVGAMYKVRCLQLPFTSSAPRHARTTHFVCSMSWRHIRNVRKLLLLPRRELEPTDLPAAVRNVLKAFSGTDYAAKLAPALFPPLPTDRVGPASQQEEEMMKKPVWLSYRKYGSGIKNNFLFHMLI